MKRITVIIAALMVHSVHAAIQTLPFTDHFTYADGNVFTVAAGVWDAAGNTGVEITASNAAALTAPAGLVASSGKGVRWFPSGTGRRAGVQLRREHLAELVEHRAPKDHVEARSSAGRLERREPPPVHVPASEPPSVPATT